MTYEEMIEKLNDINNMQELELMALPHCRNLLFQLNKRDEKKEVWFNHVMEYYVAIRSVEYGDDLHNYICAITEKTNDYMNFLWPPNRNPFSHQADFTSSIVPEMLCLIFNSIIKNSGQEIEVSAQKDLTIECIFDISGGGSMRFKNKRVDVAVVKTCQLSFNDTSTEFPIPLLAIECKTNLDKNMISGIEHSVEELKKTFPDCKYFVITELSDFDVKKSNYASSGIDEMYIFRKQKRAVTRRTPEMRQDLQPDLVYEVAQILIQIIQKENGDVEKLNTRMVNGKLIGRT